MLEQWQADMMLRAPKVYSGDGTVRMGRGTDRDYGVQNADELEHYLLDVRRSLRNPLKARFQLRSQHIVLARMCTSVPHTNPDGVRITFPHFHTYQEGHGDRFAEEVGPFPDLLAALNFFCDRINLARPEIQEGLV